MSGIYIHIPLCKSRCFYCNFYSTTAIEKQEQLVDALLLEIDKRQNYLTDKHIQTIYFGGGTPSLLTTEHIQKILNAIQEHFILSENTEITLEANPDDLTPLYLKELYSIGINRLSIGIQSFNNNILKTINRRHTAEEAIESVKNAQMAGFNNISIDLMYGFSGQTLKDWTLILEKAMQMNIQHISAYGLTYEKGTILYNQLRQNKISAVSDEDMNLMYDALVDILHQNLFEQYEVSNFAKSGFYSRHNSSYWNNTPYLGIGPAAHYFYNISRQWNVNSLNKYITNLQTGHIYSEKEVLSLTDRYNEFIMLALRTTRGIDLTELLNIFGQSWYDYCLAQAQNSLHAECLTLENNFLKTTQKGFKILNLITETLLQV